MRTTLTMTASAVLLIALAGCGSPASVPVPVPAAPAASASPTSSGLRIADAWVKSAESGMSAAFGTLENGSDRDVRVVGATSSASPMIELHDTRPDDAGQMTMREKDGGFVVPAGGSYELAPGGNHIMLMGLEQPIAAGDSVDLTLTLDDGSEYAFTAPVKDYAGADETYEGDGAPMDMPTDMPMDR
jgi:copper(I)-binding protein